MGLLDGAIQSIVGAALKGVALDLTLTQETGGTYVPGSGISGDTSTAYACKGFVDDEIGTYQESGMVTKGDRVVILLQSELSATPTVGDKITARGTQSTIESVRQDPAIATWVLGVSP